MLRSIRNIFYEIRNFQSQQLQGIQELEWAHIYHDTIRGRKWLEEISISPGRWAVNYSFLYVLVRILSQYKPHNILELGLGESSKIISAFIKNEMQKSNHTIIEHNSEWIDSFKARYSLSVNTNILQLNLHNKTIKNNIVTSYENIESINQSFDLYIIDGPFGSDRFSRYEILTLLEKKINDEFIVIMDDYNRIGEKDTVNDLFKLFKERKIKIYSCVYSGKKEQIIIATDKFKYVTSL